jgi:hypothetical protein
MIKTIGTNHLIKTFYLSSEICGIIFITSSIRINDFKLSIFAIIMGIFLLYIGQNKIIKMELNNE